MSGLRSFFASMTGRIFAILAAGMVGAALIATVITSAKSGQDFQRQRRESAADQLESYIDLIDAIPAHIRTTLLGTLAGLIRVQPDGAAGVRVDTEFQNLLATRGGLVSKATAQIASPTLCLPEIRSTTDEDARRLWQSEEVQQVLRQLNARSQRDRPREQDVTVVPPLCRLIELSLTDGTSLRLSLYTPWVQRERNRLFDPAFIGLLVAAIGILAYIVARTASAPLKRLSAAASELGQDLDRAPVDVSGPREVRRAAEAFNAMQKRLQQHVGERTQMLASITHDLQTPLTRLRLRLERVEDEALRDRLISDLAAMSALIEEGLELARSADTSEPRVMLDLDSLLGSLVEDAVDAGADATFEQTCGATLLLRPLAARRLFGNLLDNALKYGGCARVSAERSGDGIIVRVRDCGPGLPANMLERVFDPFVRLETSRSRHSGGSGLGLTIARMLAEKNGATLTLRNHPQGGLEALVHWPDIRPLTGTRPTREARAGAA